MCLLWDAVVSEVVEQLEKNRVPPGSRIWWCPTSYLTDLPFHAAGTSEHAFMDSYISSYTPTLKALIDARQTTSLSATSSGLYPRLLVVAPPDTRFQFADQELSIPGQLGSFVESPDSSATQESILQRIPFCNWIHLICDGFSQSRNAFDSALITRDGTKLTLRDIIPDRLPDAKFAFLAASRSAKQDLHNSVSQDEIFRLASAMQLGGFRSVVGTPWEMEDDDGPRVAHMFYKKMLGGADDAGQKHTRAARVLWEVTRRMKERGFPLSTWASFVHIGA